MTRVLITGSRSWDDINTIRDALAEQFMKDPDAVLVSGAQRSRRVSPDGKPEYFGADYLCEKVWEAFGGRVERHAANWVRYNRRAGYVRNEYMVEMGADVCIAFIKNRSKGATHTVKLAKQRGIPVIIHRIDDKPRKSLKALKEKHNG